MKIVMKKAWFVLGLLIAGMGSASAATLVPQKGVSILFINGQKSQSKIGENQINDGYNQLVVRFDHNYGNSSGVYTSSPYVIMFDVAGEEIKIRPPKARSKMEAQKIFEADKPKWRVVEDDREIKYQQGII
ncbi:DUF2057 domain-containing protein, partial [Vibrio makurazakiensis]|uniref:DUF2057 family protein n=1 Tax=Vibrio makurazakiensis TaxID=2910250 RepID=UPI003D141177